MAPLLFVSVADAAPKGVDVGPDRGICTGAESWIEAFDPDGSPIWTVVQNPRAFALIDIAVGSDGNICAAATSGTGVPAPCLKTGHIHKLVWFQCHDLLLKFEQGVM